VQLDVFGEIADAIFQTIKAGMAPPDRATTTSCVGVATVPHEFEPGGDATPWRRPG
jgi:hypothetical protein